MNIAHETPVPSTRQAFDDLRRVLRYAAPFKGRFLGKLAYSSLAIIPAVLLPWPGKVLVDHVIQDIPFEDTRYPFFFQPIIDALQGESPTIIALTMFLFLAALLVLFGRYRNDAQNMTDSNLEAGFDTATHGENFANYGHSYMGGLFGWLEYRLTILLSQDINHHYRSHLFDYIQRLPMTELEDRRIGDTIYRLMYDTPQITGVCYQILITAVVTPFMFMTTILVMATTYEANPQVWIPALFMIPCALTITLPLSQLMRRIAMNARSAGASTTANLEEGISNVLAVQSLGGQQHEKERFKQNSWASFSTFRTYMVVWLFVMLIALIGGVPSFLYVIITLTDEVFAARMSVGDLGVILAFYMQLAVLALAIGPLWIYLQEGVVGLRRVFELMDRPADPQPEQALALAGIEAGFVFEDVGYRYPDGTQALRNVNFEARRGEMIALVGPAGAGKTTLAQLIPRFLSPSEGRILVDGKDLASLDREDLRQQIAFVFQEPLLFDATPLENIRLGKPDASLEQAREAARLARADDFICALPQGYDTPLGRAGGRLSVGQKQRISIARALVRGAPVLVLDEPTSALDPQTESQLVQTLREISEDRLVFVIAHRLSTIRSAKQILFLRDGEIIERGDHPTLVAITDGAYRQFVELQSGTA